MTLLPPTPGTGEIPPGTIRLFHYTHPDYLDSIREQGLLYDKGRGDSGTGRDEPSKGVWASTMQPKEDVFRNRPVVEYWAHPEQLSRNAEHYWHEDPLDWATNGRPHYVIMQGDVPPNQFVAIHEPWHTHYNYLIDRYPTPDSPHLAEMGGPNAFDWTMDPKLGGDPDLSRAVQEWKRTLWPEGNGGTPKTGAGERQYLPDDWTGSFWHRAPTTERDRIRTHGLVPGTPRWSENWYETGKDPTGNIHPDQPPGVYLGSEPTFAFSSGRPSDLWRVDPAHVLSGQPDPHSLGSFIADYPIAPEALTLHEPWEGSELAWAPLADEHRRDQDQQIAEKREYKQMLDSGNALGIGQPTAAVHVPAEGFEEGQQLVNQDRVNGVLPRGTPIHYQDPRIPDTVYHVTTNLPAVQETGYLQAGGVGGLGGDSNDKIVSMTLDPQIAEQLASDMRFTGGLHRTLGEPPPYTWNSDTRKWEGDRTPWAQRLMALFKQHARGEGWEWGEHHPLQLESYGLNDWLNQYFVERESRAHIRNPLFFGEHYKQFAPDRIGVVPIPRENLNNGALLTDFDLGHKNYGLQEIRSYGDVPLPRTSHVKLASPLYLRWVFSPVSGKVTLSDNTGHPADVKYHGDLARELNEPNLVHGYAYRIGDGWRLTDWESKPLSDTFVIAQVMRALQADQAARKPENGSWDPSYEEQWDRMHLGLPT